MLLGVRAVIAESFERIHRSNLAGMGVLPLQFMPGENAASHNLTGREIYNITGLKEIHAPRGELTVSVLREDNSSHSFKVRIRLDTQNEVNYFYNRGIMNTILLNLV